MTEKKRRRAAPWPRPVIFNMKQLPKWACSLDHLMYPFMAELTDAQREWFWQFPICVGRIRMAPVRKIRTLCSACTTYLRSNRRRAMRHLMSNFHPRPSAIRAAEILQSWIESLDVMIRLAKGSEPCWWFTPVVPEDGCCYLEAWSETCNRMLVGLQKAHEKATEECEPSKCTVRR